VAVHCSLYTESETMKARYRSAAFIFFCSYELTAMNMYLKLNQCAMEELMYCKSAVDLACRFSSHSSLPLAVCEMVCLMMQANFVLPRVRVKPKHFGEFCRWSCCGVFKLMSYTHLHRGMNVFLDIYIRANRPFNKDTRTLLFMMK